ncbi:MAG: DUF5060 domain-containing protein [Armatimonadetes bacterium]|nr:DUF5060 domain-containing protein [Armatimonadota bacterium]
MLIQSFLIGFGLLFLTAVAMGASVEQWSHYEARFDGPREGQPYRNVQLSATFTQGQQRVVVPGFWDGEGTYKVRFMPPAPGEWSYETKSNRPELNGKKGSFKAVQPSSGNHGPVRVAHTWHFEYADGEPYFQVGTTAYVWTHQTEALQEQTLKTLAASPFNKIRFCVFPKSYAYNQNEPPFFAFERKGDGSFDFNRPNPAFWRHFERRILDLQRLGIEADLILWHPYDRWGFAEMGDANDDRYLRYCIARLSAFRNVWWSLANEFDAMKPNDVKGHRGDKTMEDWDRFFRILQDEDPHGRLRSIHNMRGFYDHTKPWVTHASIQRHDLPSVLQWRREFRKPIVVDECGYEGTIPQGWGNLSPQEMTRRFWIGTMRGGYVGHGETYRHPQDILWWSKGGTLHGESPARIAFLKKIMEAVPFHAFTPQEEPSPGAYHLSREGDTYFLYFTNTAKATIRLAGNRPYKLDGIDTWGMKIDALGSAQPGEFAFEPPQADYLVRLTAYQPGEKLRPEVNARASVLEGAAPLEVRFSVETPGSVRWDFGDGSTSSERNPVHTYREPGIYNARVTVTELGGASATRLFPIAVDRATTDPLVRAGFSSGDSHTLKINGPAKHAGDTLTFGGSEPWSWVSVGDKPIADLNGLRFFTISGWVKPTSLKTGSGGNRIAFNLNGQSSGFDLVHLDDGRLRLAVNEWPDGVKNDSSPGKLRVGEWTFFAVTYDATKAKENVRWYFGGEGRPAELDRIASYNAGVTGRNSANLTLGNYNETMHGHGLDRQFRGEIRRLQIFGSRIGSAGALEPAKIRELQLDR